MFKLSFFLIFVLAGLCFGVSSEDVSSSGSEASSGSSGAGTGEISDVGAPSASSGTTEIPIERLNSSIPDFVGDYQHKKTLVSRLVSNCDNKRNEKSVAVDSMSLKTEVSNKPPSSAVNLDSLDFKNCTYVCKPPNNETTFMMHMPEGTVCDVSNKTCPESGPCPIPPIPAC
uniref:Putative ixodes 8-cys protein n=1 Tax=Ixodes ricinus TaxID=34613 RepID=A0A0K8R919_IXORI